MLGNAAASSRWWWKWASGVLLIATACAQTQPTTVQSPVPAGQARIWLYRDWQPSESLNLANIDANGSYFASVANGKVVYRDVPPGRYRLVPDSFVPNMYQDAAIELAPGQQAYLKIVSLAAWGGNNTASKNIARDAFWVWLIPPKLAEGEIAAIRQGI